jgi:hypothetical protein
MLPKLNVMALDELLGGFFRRVVVGAVEIKGVLKMAVAAIVYSYFGSLEYLRDNRNRLPLPLQFEKEFFLLVSPVAMGFGHRVRSVLQLTKAAQLFRTCQLRYQTALLPKLDVMAVDKLFGRFDGGRVIPTV